MHVVFDTRLALFWSSDSNSRPKRTEFAQISIVESDFIGSHSARQALTLILDLQEASEGNEFETREIPVTYWRTMMYLLQMILN